MTDIAEVEWPIRRVSFTFTHATCGDNRFAPMIQEAMAEYLAANDHWGVLEALDAKNGVRVDVRNHTTIAGELPGEKLPPMAKPILDLIMGQLPGHARNDWLVREAYSRLLELIGSRPA